jgi:hypothetical protein
MRLFWEAHIAKYSASPAAFQHSELQDSTPLFQTCREPERSEAVKTCVTVIEDAARFRWQKYFETSDRRPSILKYVRNISLFDERNLTGYA